MYRTNSKRNRWSVINHSLFSLFIISSLVELGNIGAGLIDGLIVSRFYDPAALAAVGIASPMFFISCIVSGLFVGGMQNRCTQELGKGDIGALNRIFSTVFYISAVVSFLFSISEFVFARQLAALFGAQGSGAELAVHTEQYIKGLSTGFPGLVLAVLVSTGCILDSERKRASRAALVYIVFNTVFDLIAVKTGLGIFGIGLATSLGVYVELGYLLIHFTKKDRLLRFTKPEIRPAEILRIVSSGTEKVIRYTLNTISMILMNKLIIHYGGALAMSAMAVRNQVDDFADIMALALAEAVSIQAGVLYGEKNSEAIRATGNYAHRCCALFLGGVCVIGTLLSGAIASIYISDRGELFRMSVFAVGVTALLQPLNALVRARISYLQAVNKTKNMRILSFLTFFVYQILGAAVLGDLFGAYGVLSSFLLALALSMMTVWIYYAVKTKKAVPSPEDYLALPESIRFSPDDVISLAITGSEDISPVAEQIQLFCKVHRAGDRTGMKAALCFEELTTNVIKFGFPKCRKHPVIDLRLVYTNEETVMRLRDNCPMFDVERYIAQELNSCESGDEVRLGLKMVGGMAEKISYVHSLETNNVILHFPNDKIRSE